MVGKGLGHRKQYFLGVEVGNIGVSIGHFEFAYDGGTIARPGIVDKESLVGPKLGVECQAEHALLAATGKFGSDVQEYGGHARAWLQYLDHSSLLDDEQAVGAVVGMGRI